MLWLYISHRLIPRRKSLSDQYGARWHKHIGHLNQYHKRLVNLLNSCQASVTKVPNVAMNTSHRLLHDHHAVGVNSHVPSIQVQSFSSPWSHSSYCGCKCWFCCDSIVDLVLISSRILSLHSRSITKGSVVAGKVSFDRLSSKISGAVFSEIISKFNWSIRGLDTLHALLLRN
jgi:hypothetical protein